MGNARISDISARKRTAEELRQYRDDLETLTKSRTAELLAANESLQREIAERNRAEEALRDQMKQGEMVIDTALDGFFWIDDKGSIRRANRAAEQILGYTREELEGMHIADIEAQETAEEIEEHIEAIGKTGQARFETKHRRKDGRIIDVEVSSRFATLGGRRVFFSFVRDITRRIRSETALRDARDQLEARVRERTAELEAANVLLYRQIAERQEAEEQARTQQAELAHVLRVSTMGEMASSLAHEINQPLAAVATYAEACKQKSMSETLTGEDARRLMDSIIQEAHLAGGIIRHIRNFVRKQEARTSSVDLNDSIRGAIRLLAAETKSDWMTVRLELDQDLPLVIVDGIQIQQVILNLLRNAIEAMSEVQQDGHELIIRTSRVDGTHVEIAVSDTGSGIADDQIDRVFDHYVTTKAEGLGMGLPISRSIVEAHRGRLWATSNPDKGMTFKFVLPLEEEDDSHDN